MKTICKFFILIITILLLTSCWDRREVSHMLIVTSVALDKTYEGKILVTLLSPVPKGMQSDSTSESNTQSVNAVIISEDGEGIMDAYRKIEMKLSREIFFSQIESIIIGEKLASDGVAEVLDFFARQRETPLKTYILFAKGEAASVIKANSLLEKNSAEKIRKLEYLNINIKMLLKDFFYSLTEEGIQPIAPAIQRVPSERSSEYSKKQVISLSGAAVFNNDKLIDWINPEEARGVLWLQNKIETGVITTYISEEKGGGKVAGEIIRSKTKIAPVLKGEELIIKVDVHTEANINENTSKLDLGDPDVVHNIEENYEKEIKYIINLSLEKVKNQLNVDVLGFGTKVHGKYPKQWENDLKKSWEKDFAHLNVKVSCRVKIFGTGFDTKSVTRKEKEFIK